MYLKMVDQIYFFYIIMAVFVRSNIAKFGQHAGFSKKVCWFAPKDYIGHVKTKIQYNTLKQKLPE